MGGVARTGALRCTVTPGREAPSCPERVGDAAKGGRGTWEIGESMPSACGWRLLLDWSVFLPSFPSLRGEGHRCSYVCGPPTVCHAFAALEAVIACHWVKPVCGE